MTSQEQVVAGYFVYGPSTTLVYTEGRRRCRASRSTPVIGEFLLSHPDIRIPSPRAVLRLPTRGRSSAVARGAAPLRRVRCKTSDPARAGPTRRAIPALSSSTSTGSSSGGIYLYPATATTRPTGKLRLMYEAAPLALVAEAAGGAASRRHAADRFHLPRGEPPEDPDLPRQLEGRRRGARERVSPPRSAIDWGRFAEDLSPQGARRLDEHQEERRS